MEHNKFMQYGRGLGLWQNPRENIKPEPVTYFKDDPIYLTPAKGKWVDQIQQCKKENNPLENGVFIWTEIKGSGHAFISIHEGNNATVFTYGRFGRRSGIAGVMGDGILNFYSLKMRGDITEKNCTKWRRKHFSLQMPIRKLQKCTLKICGAREAK